MFRVISFQDNGLVTFKLIFILQNATEIRYVIRSARNFRVMCVSHHLCFGLRLLR